MTFWIAATAFIATNVDDLFLLTMWFVQGSRFATVLRGQLAGFSAILLVSLVGYLGVRLLPESAVHWLGLAPVAIGIKQLVSAVDKNARAQAGSMWGIATITFANGSDNIAVYTTLFSRLTPWYVGWITITFYSFLLIYVTAGYFFASNLRRSDQVHRWAHRIAPLVIIGIGLVILLSH